MLIKNHRRETLMDINNRVRWLRIASAFTIAFGLLMATAAVPALQAPMAFMLDFVYLPVDGAPTLSGEAPRLLNAITGGLMAGWGVMLWLVATELLPQNPALGRRLILIGIGTWFVIDSSMSVAAGAPLNALFNTGFLLLFFLPVWTLGGDATPARRAT